MSILFFDIDNTLFSHRTFTIPKSAMEALRKAKENGHYLVLCSGRGFSGIVDFYDPELFDGAVCSSGGNLVWKNQIVASHPIPDSVIFHLIELAKIHESGLSMQGEDCSWLSDDVLDIIRHGQKRESYIRRLHIHRLETYHGETIFKLDYFFPDLEHALAMLKEVPCGLEVCKLLRDVGIGSGCEITAEGVNKGTGIRELLQYLHADISDSYGFGDSENDLEMLKACGTGIAMGNAADSIKQLSDYVTDDIEEDGIFNAMKHFGFI